MSESTSSQLVLSSLEGNLSDKTTNLKKFLELSYSLSEMLSEEALTTSGDVPSLSIPPFPLTLDHYLRIDAKTREILEIHSPLFSHLLEKYLQVVENYFKAEGKRFDFGVTLQEDPEDPEFWAIVIVVNTLYRDLDEKMELTFEIGARLDNATETLAESIENKNVLDVSSSITFTIEKGKYE